LIAGQDHDVLGPVALDNIYVLEHRVGGSVVPLRLRDALRRRQDVETLVAFRAEEVPAALQVADQGVGLVLRGDADAADAGVQGVGKGEVYDPCLATKVDSRFCPDIGQFVEPAAAPPG
jgi:hypothetical protein